MKPNKQKVFIINCIDQNDNRYEHIDHYFKQANSLYLNSRHRLNELTDVSRYLNYYDKLYDINEDFAEEIKRTALVDYEMKKAYNTINYSSMKFSIYNSDVTFENQNLLIDMINCNIYFDFINNIKSIHSFKIYKNKHKYLIEIECVIDLAELNVITQVNNEFVNQMNNNKKDCYIQLKNNYDCNTCTNRVYIENRNKSGSRFDKYENLILCQKKFEQKLNKDKNIAIQMMQSI